MDLTIAFGLGVYVDGDSTILKVLKLLGIKCVGCKQHLSSHSDTTLLIVNKNIFKTNYLLPNSLLCYQIFLEGMPSTKPAQPRLASQCHFDDATLV
jgi:hypothetical protein